MSGVGAEQSTETDALLLRLAVAYYVPLGWAIDDGEEVDPDDLAECLRSMQPVAAEVERIVAERLDARDAAWSEVVAADAFRAARLSPPGATP